MFQQYLSSGWQRLGYYERPLFFFHLNITFTSSTFCPLSFTHKTLHFDLCSGATSLILQYNPTLPKRRAYLLFILFIAFARTSNLSVSWSGYKPRWLKSQLKPQEKQHATERLFVNWDQIAFKIWCQPELFF